MKKDETTPAAQPEAKGKAKATAKDDGFSEEERAAMKARAEEMKAEAKRTKSGKKADGTADLLAAIEAMTPEDKAISTRLHAIISENAPDLSPKTWYGMPAYANADGKAVLFFRGAGKFKERYMTLGFNEQAKVDEGTFWPTAYALTELTPEIESRIAALVQKAIG